MGKRGRFSFVGSQLGAVSHRALGQNKNEHVKRQLSKSGHIVLIRCLTCIF